MVVSRFEVFLQYISTLSLKSAVIRTSNRADFSDTPNLNFSFFFILTKILSKIDSFLTFYNSL